MTPGAASRRNRAAAEIVAVWEAFLRVGVLVCAVLLALAAVAPTELARTAWITDGTKVTDSPAGYVGWVSVLGGVAVGLVVLGAGVRRARVPATCLAAAVFVLAALGMARHWVGVANGWVGVAGRTVTEAEPASDWVQFPVLLPIFLAYAVVGATCAATLGWFWGPGGPEA